MKRVEIIDSLRGIAILVMLLFHGSYYWESELSIRDFNNILQNPSATIAMIFGKFAGIFALISGMVYGYIALYKREIKNKSTDSIIKSIIYSGLWIMVISKIHVIFFNHSHVGDPIHPYPTGPEYHTLITGSIATGTIQIPSRYLIFYRSTALFMIGVSVIWTGVLLALLMRNDGHTHYSRNFGIAGLIGTIIILATQPMKVYIRPIWVNALIQDKPLLAFFLGLLVGDPFPFFPFAGYATYGMMFGMAFFVEVRQFYVSLIAGISGMSYLGIGIYLYILRGYTKITDVNEMPEIELNFIQIGMMILFCAIIYNVHYFRETNPVRKLFLSSFLRRFGVMTLTIFMYEPLVGTIIKVILLDPIFVNWSSNLVLVVLYSLFLILLWNRILIIWEGHNFVGSWEWLNARILAYISGTPTTRLNIRDNLHYTDMELEATTR